MRYQTLAWVAALSVLTLSGCGKAAEEAAEKALELSASADGEEVDVEIDGESGTMTVASSEGDVTISADAEEGSFEMTNADGSVAAAAGSAAKIPDEFPSDVPVYPGLKLDAVVAMPGEGYSISGTVPDSPEEVRKFYQSETSGKGWNETSSISQEELTSLSYEQGDRTMKVTAMLQGDATDVSIFASTQ